MTKKSINYSTLREDYSAFECENGQILRIKTTIMNIIFDEDTKKTGIEFKDISNVFTPTTIDTSDYEESTSEQVTQEHERERLVFTPIKQVINIYETDRSLIIIYPVIERIFLTNKKDKKGDPILRYHSKNSVNVIDKKMFAESPSDTQNI